jgi:hypothetical protein
MDGARKVNLYEAEFSFRSLPLRCWLGLNLAASVATVVLWPPAFWLSAVGAMFLACASLANSLRTEQWFVWQLKGSLNWFEGCVASTGIVFVAVPIFDALVRTWL